MWKNLNFIFIELWLKISFDLTTTDNKSETDK